MEKDEWMIALANATARAEAAEAALEAAREELDDLMAQRDTAEQELATMREPCVWRMMGGTWAGSGYDTGCKAWYRPSMKDVAKFCPNCGRSIEVQPEREVQPCPL